MADHARVVASVLVGRERELELLASAVSSPPAVVTVEGEAGIGKTRLVSELAGLPSVAGRRWLSGGCRRIREPLPLGPVLDAVRGAEEELGGLRLSPVVGALRPLLPELADVLPAPLAPLGDRVAERQRIFRALVEVLSRLGAVVLVLEDMHWADEQTLEFIAYMTTDPPPGLALVLTFRPEGVDPSLRASIAKPPRSVARVEVSLAPLNAAQTGMLATAILGADRISEEFAEHLCARASGVPFAVEELLALLQVRGTLVRGPAGWARRALSDLDVPLGIRDPVLERVAQLSAPARAVVEAAAVIEVPVPESSLVRVCGVEEPQAAEAVDDAVASGLLEEHSHAIGFRHVLAAQAVYDVIPSRRRAAFHGRAASMLEQADPVPLGQLAHHLKCAGRVEAWVGAAEAAADAAIALGHEAEAVRLLEEPLRNASLPDEQRWRVALKLGRAASDGGSTRPGQTDLLAGVLQADMPRETRGELRFWLSMLMHNAGVDPLHQRRLLLEAIEDLEDRPDLSAWAMVTLGLAVHHGVPVSEHRRWLRRALETVPSIGDPVREVFLRGLIAMSMAYIGDPLWRSVSDDLVARTGGSPRSRREADAYLRVALAACHSGHHERGASLVAAVSHQVDASDHANTTRELTAVAALLDFYRGSWVGLAERIELLLEDLVDYPMISLDPEVLAACLAVAAGEPADTSRRLLEIAETVEAIGDRALDALVTGAVARQAVTSGEADDAVACADRFLRAVEAKGLWAPVARALPAIVHLFAVTGQQPRASSLVDRFAEEVTDLDAPLAPAALAHARGFLESAEGRAAHAAQQFLAAAAEYERLSCPYEAAQAREQAAAALFSTDAAAAERELSAALATYQKLGANWDHTRCLRLGRSHGLRFAATHRGGRKGYGDELSPRELQVARLAAKGLTNKAIAAELYLSHYTVQKHLARAMGKLGVSSRAVIATRLAQQHRDDESA